MKMKRVSLQKAQDLSGDPESIARGYVSEDIIDAAYDVVEILIGNGYTKRQVLNGRVDYPNVFSVLAPVAQRFRARQWANVDAIAGFILMNKY